MCIRTRHITPADPTSEQRRTSMDARRTIRIEWTVLALLALLAPASPVRAAHLLVAGRQGTFRSADGHDASAVVRIAGEHELDRVPPPLCPTVTTLTFALAHESSLALEDHGAVTLPCASWHATASGYRYRDPDGNAGGVLEIILGKRRLVIRAGGPHFRALTGPAIYVEGFLTVGAERYLVRLSDFRRNDTAAVVSRHASPFAAAGEAAFWNTLSAKRPMEARALALLRKAVRHDPRDGRSQFLLGALLVYHGGPAPDPMHPSPAANVESLHLAQAPLDAAVRLLPADSVLYAFRALTTYLNGVVDGDAARVGAGEAQFADAMTRNRFFNEAVELFIVPRFHAGSSDAYQPQLQRVADVLSAAPSNPHVYPDVMTSRLVPYCREGTGLFLGDVAAKGGRLDLAQTWYSVAKVFGHTSGYPFEPIVEERVAN